MPSFHFVRRKGGFLLLTSRWWRLALMLGTHACYVPTRPTVFVTTHSRFNRKQVLRCLLPAPQAHAPRTSALLFQPIKSRFAVPNVHGGAVSTTHSQICNTSCFTPIFVTRAPIFVTFTPIFVIFSFFTPIFVITPPRTHLPPGGANSIHHYY